MQDDEVGDRQPWGRRHGRCSKRTFHGGTHGKKRSLEEGKEITQRGPPQPPSRSAAKEATRSEPQRGVSRRRSGSASRRASLWLRGKLTGAGLRSAWRAGRLHTGGGRADEPACEEAPTFAQAPESGMRTQLLCLPSAAVAPRQLHTDQVPVVCADGHRQEAETEDPAKGSAQAEGARRRRASTPARHHLSRRFPGQQPAASCRRCCCWSRTRGGGISPGRRPRRQQLNLTRAHPEACGARRRGGRILANRRGGGML